MKVKFVFAMVIVLTLATFAHATTIVYNNGGPNQQNGNEMTQWIQSEDFTLTQTVRVTDVHFWDLELPNSGYQNEIDWWITPDNNGFPNMGAALLFGANLGAGVTRTQLNGGQCNILGQFCEFSDDFTFAGPGIVLTAGTYHLALHNGPPSFNSRSEFYWETTNGNGTQTGLECDLQSISDCTTGNGSDFSNNGQEHAFYLTGTTGVPEPSTLMLMGTGLLCAVGAFRRKLTL